MTPGNGRTWLSEPGVVCALGTGLKEIVPRLNAGDTSGMRPSTDWINGRSTVVGCYPEELPVIPDCLPAYHVSRNNQLLLAAALQIETALRQAISRYGDHRVGLVIGTSTSGVNDNIRSFEHRRQTGDWPSYYDYRRQALSSPSVFLADWLGCKGPVQTISTACTSSARALLSARSLILMGMCDAVVCGGADTLCRLSINGFASLGAISDRLCRPFSATRDGISIGEAGVVFLMERQARDDLAVELLGGGSSSDAWHMSSPEPNGAGPKKAMQLALKNVGLTPSDIGWVNLHGTGTELNDAMESLAMDALFPNGSVPCASTKAMTGHALGAAGALEAALTWATLSGNNVANDLPPHIWDSHADSSLPALDFSGNGQRYPTGKRPVAMSNSFAFGGNNASLILGAQA